MREIKFRGKRIDNGEWVHGDLFQKKDGLVAIRRNYHTWAEGPYDLPDPSDYEDYIVYPGTVGQFTGLKDRNSKEIYEGDIVKFHFMTSNSCSTKLFPTEKFFGKITMNKYNHWSIFSNGMEIHIENAIKYGEVIGNIHDNPELFNERP